MAPTGIHTCPLLVQAVEVDGDSVEKLGMESNCHSLECVIFMI